MAWEQRNGRGMYYTHSIRKNGRVERMYFKGEPAVALALFKEWYRLQRAEERRVFEVEKARYAGLEEAMAVFNKDCDQLFEQAMIAAGYHQHKSEWRKARHPNEEP